MSSMEELREAIVRLDPAHRATLMAWLESLDFSLDEVREPAAAYQVTPQPISVDEYLSLEETATVRHEYVAGQIFAMTGTTLRHNVIIQNLVLALSPRLAGGPCRAFFTDIKVRLKVDRADIFYYPDLLVACGKLDLDAVYLSEPKVVVEVLSSSTEAIDRREKALNYRQAESLEEYVLIAQRAPEVTIYRRRDGWSGHRATNISQAVEFESVKEALALTEIYRGVFA